jgi:hypothetical protein
MLLTLGTPIFHVSSRYVWVNELRVISWVRIRGTADDSSDISETGAGMPGYESRRWQ